MIAEINSRLTNFVELVQGKFIANTFIRFDIPLETYASRSHISPFSTIASDSKGFPDENNLHIAFFIYPFVQPNYSVSKKWSQSSFMIHEN